MPLQLLTTNITISNTQHHVLEDAANFPESPIEKFTQALPAGARGLMIQALERKGCIEKRGDNHYITRAGCNAVGRDATPCKARGFTLVSELSSGSVLLVGEGNLTFALSLAGHAS